MKTLSKLCASQRTRRVRFASEFLSEGMRCKLAACDLKRKNKEGSPTTTQTMCGDFFVSLSFSKLVCSAIIKLQQGSVNLRCNKKARWS